jgi:hypothetical protein
MSGFTVKIEKTSEVLDNVTAILDDSIVDLVVEAVAAKYGWSEASEMTKARFFSYQVRMWAFDVVKAYQVELATKQAQQATIDAMNALESTMVFEEPTA